LISLLSRDFTVKVVIFEILSKRIYLPVIYKYPVPQQRVELLYRIGFFHSVSQSSLDLSAKAIGDCFAFDKM
jgi:hypothetical protein